MNVIEKAEKALEHLRNIEGSSKNHVIQAAAATLGRRLGALGSRQNFSRHYANLLHSALPTLLSLASNDSAEMRLVGDEALNRVIVGGFAFHSYKTNVLLQNQIDPSKNARWIRAALSRICLGDSWLRPGVGKIRSQAQTLFPKLSQIVRETTEVQLIVEALESNLPRILKGLAEYTTDEEISDFSKALMTHIESNEPAVRRGISNCIGHLCSYREPLLTNVLEIVYGKLWPLTSDSNAILGWFSVIKSIFQINNVQKFADNDLFSVQDYLELYTLCIHYIQQSTNEHNIQNTVLECLTVLLNNAKGKYRKALLEKHPKIVVLDSRQMDKGHRRNISSTSIIPAQTTNLTSELREPEIQLSGALHLGSLLQLSTPSLSVDDLSIHTPDSPVSDTDMNITDSEQLTKDLNEKLQEIEDTASTEEDVVDSSPLPLVESAYKINIGSLTDDDILLKYCARLLASKFILTGDKGGLINDRSIRVSVKSSALNCLSEVLKLYPQAITMYLDKDAEAKSHNVSGSTENTDSNLDNINDFILERNVCYQDSLTDSLSQDLFNRSMDSQQASQMSKKDAKSNDIEKSMESLEQKSSLKDIQSNIMDSKAFKNELIASAMSADNTNANMTYSNFTTNSNMTGSSIDHASTGYPMSTSGDVLSSSIDLDIKFDHFGESNTNLDNQKDYERPKKILQRTQELHSKDIPDSMKKDKIDESVDFHEFEFQHMSEIFSLLEGHNDPQIRGLVRLCIGNYLCASLDLSHGDYHRWKIVSHLSKHLYDSLSIDNLMNIVLKGLSDEIHSTVNHTLSSLVNLSSALCNSTQWSLLIDILNCLVDVEVNRYWLCRVNLCKLYEKFPYQRLFTLYSDFRIRSKNIMETLIRLLADQDHKVRSAAIQALVSTMPHLRPPLKATPTSTTTEMTYNYSSLFKFSHDSPALSIVRNMYFYSDLPEQMRFGNGAEPCLRSVVGDLFWRLMSSSCRYFSQGLLETLQAITHKWLPWQHTDSYTDQGILSYCLESVNATSSPVVFKTVLLDLCCRLYPVEIHSIMRHKSSNYDIFERDLPSRKWQHLDDAKTANLSEKFLQITLKMLNLLVHLIEEVNPNIHLNKGGIALPGSPVRKKSQESIQKKPEPVTGSLRKKPTVMSSLKSNLSGHFYNEPVYMKLYENLRAAYSNHKINLDPKSSIFYEFLSTTLHCLAVQLELSTEKEFGAVTEELLFYLKVIMPLRADLTVYCITQLLKCLFGTNMINQYTDFLSITDKVAESHELNFFQDIMLMNSFEKIESRRDSVSSNSSQMLSKDTKMAAEKQLLIALENFSKNKIDKKWNTNKRELERYIRLFEPVVIQALKSYTMQSDIPLQCKVLALLNQLLALRVNYCLLDSDQIFIAFLMKQLQFVELQEIPDCCDLVNSLLTFLVQLSTSKHHSEQIIEIPKLIQVCDGLMASGGHMEFIAGIEPVAIKVFSNMSGTNILGRTQQQEAQATKEVLFYMLQKTMHQPKVLDLVSCVLCLSRDQSENYNHWCELASHTLLNLLSQSSVEIDTFESIKSLERLIDCLFKDVLLEQNRVEVLLKILFKAPPDQATSPYKLKVRYLSIIMVLLRKILILVPESEILLTINTLKATHIAPSSIFFNVKPDIDPLNVLNVNENCANLSPDVILVRFLFKTLTFAILELDNCNEIECGNLDLKSDDIKGENHRLLYAVCVNIIVQVKHMLHLTDDCHFPLTSKTAQSLLQNEQSGLNTGLYSPEENIPMELLNLICIRCAHRMPMLTIHWSHLLIRLNFISNKCWQRLTGFVGRTPLSDNNRQSAEILHIACVMAYCEYFTIHGLSEVVQLTWLLVNRVHILLTYYTSTQIVKQLIHKVQENVTASGLLLQAMAARCQHCLKDEFALNTYKVLSICHESQSGALVFLICRIIGKLEPAVSVRFAKLAIQRCRLLKDMEPEQISMQLSKEDVQVALEMLQREKVYVRYPSLVVELNSLASSVFDLSPLDLSQDRAINPQYIATTNVDGQWLVNQVKNRCSQSECALPKVPKYYDLARLLSNLTKDNLSTVMACSEFDRKILNTTFKVSCDNFLKEFLNMEAVFESREITRDSMRDTFSSFKAERKASVDSNKLTNTIHVFKKSDNKESKSQFFIPITDTDNMKDKFGNLQLTEEDLEFTMPDLPELYKASLVTFDSALTEIIRLFPKQNRPLSQSENFDLNIEQTIDRYTRRCHQVFQDKLFYQEFVTLQSVLNGFLESVDRILILIDEFDCELVDNCIENILPISTAKNIAIFCVISLQYLSFLIKNKKIVESPVQADVSFRATATVTDDIVVNNVILLTVENVSKAFGIREIWTELNTDSNLNRIQSAISCLYAVVKYLVKDKKPLTLKRYIQQDSGPKSDVVIVGDKLITLIEYWETNMYGDRVMNVLDHCYKVPLEQLIVHLSRLEMINNIALIPPLAWTSVDITKKDLLKIDLPLHAFQDMDVLEAFLFRVNLIGWSSKKQFEEIWVGLLGALQGNGTHWAVRGITALLVSAAPMTRKGVLHVPRTRLPVTNGHQLLRNIVLGTSAYKLFEDVNLERIPMMNDGYFGYHYAQFNSEYLKMAGDTTDEKGTAKTRRELKRIQRTDIDVNSCLQLLMDIASDMLEPKASTGLSARLALISCIAHTTGIFSTTGHWVWACTQLSAVDSVSGALLYGAAVCLPTLKDHVHLHELSTVHQRLLKSLTSSNAAVRAAGLHGCLLQLHEGGAGALTAHLHAAATHGVGNARISLYEQSLYWAVLFTLVEQGHPELMNLAVDFLLTNPYHYCTDLVVKGITSVLRQQVLPKDLKNIVIEKLLDNMRNYSEHHAMQILMVHLFSADTKLLSPKLTNDVSNMDPDILMNSMERMTLLYKVLRQCKNKESKLILSNTLKYFLRETLPPAATLSRVVIEFVESCKETERKSMSLMADRERAVLCSVLNSEIVFEVFETSVAQDQLPVLSGWIFEALCHLLNGKLTPELLPFCVLTLLVCASPNPHIRLIAPLIFNVLKYGFYNNVVIDQNWGVFKDILKSNKSICFKDRRLLCIVALKSSFSGSQIERLKELCLSNDCLKDLFNCLSSHVE